MDDRAHVLFVIEVGARGDIYQQEKTVPQRNTPPAGEEMVSLATEDERLPGQASEMADRILADDLV